jgi:hypothetical protein
LSDVAGARLLADGTVDALAEGALTIDAEYASHRAQAHVRLARDRPGQVLAVVRGQVYAESEGTLHPIADAHVEVVAGPSAGLSTTTLDDGSYEFVGVTPGDLTIRASKAGYTAAEGSIQLRAGDNRLSLPIEMLPPTMASSL